MKIQPISDHIVIKPVSKEQKTESGILIPDTAKEEKPEQGKVVAVGPGKVLSSGERKPMEVEKDDHVLFTKYGPSQVNLKGQKYLIASSDDILAILK